MPERAEQTNERNKARRKCGNKENDREQRLRIGHNKLATTDELWPEERGQQAAGSVGESERRCHKELRARLHIGRICCARGRLTTDRRQSTGCRGGRREGEEYGMGHCVGWQRELPAAC